MGLRNAKKAFVPPVIVKTEEQKDRLKAGSGEEPCRSCCGSALRSGQTGEQVPFGLVLYKILKLMLSSKWGGLA